jgi:N-acetylmuramoyl-L-alanine amidase
MANAISRAIINYKNERDANFKSEVVINEPIENSTVQKDLSNLRFKIQIAASTKKLALKSYNFKGLSSLSLEKSDQLYRYFYQETSSYKKAKKFLKEAKSKGYTKAFIVAYDQNEKIPIGEALRRLE